MNTYITLFSGTAASFSIYGSLKWYLRRIDAQIEVQLKDQIVLSRLHIGEPGEIGEYGAEVSLKTIFDQLLLFQLVREQALDKERGLKYLIDSSKHDPNLRSSNFLRIMSQSLESINSTDAQKEFLNYEDENMNVILNFKKDHHELFLISYEEVKGMLNDFQTKLADSYYQRALKLLFYAWDSLKRPQKKRKETKEKLFVLTTEIISSDDLQFSADKKLGYREFCYSFIGIKRSLTETGCKRLFNDQINSKEFVFFSKFLKKFSQEVQKKKNDSNP